MANFAPAWGRVRRVVTIHDLQYQAVPDQLSRPVRALTGALISLAAYSYEHPADPFPVFVDSARLKFPSTPSSTNQVCRCAG